VAIEEVCGVRVLGSIPRLDDADLPERHLGLLMPDEHPEADRAIGRARAIVNDHVDVERILALAAAAPALDLPAAPVEQEAAPDGAQPRLRIGVVRDRVFSFYYPENLEALQDGGADLIAVSALTDRDLPGLDALYIGGGYPEMHAAALAANAGFRAALRQAIEGGLPVIAECGGLIYLSEAVVTGTTAHPMVGIFPVVFELGSRPQGHGYACAEVEDANPFFAVGTTLSGHEFRYSFVRGGGPEAPRPAFRMRRGHGFDGERDGLVYKNVLASFCHFHTLGAREWAGAILHRARSYAAGREALAAGAH
jgi:cobyrinic acid a,c-diamide synthase